LSAVDLVLGFVLIVGAYRGYKDGFLMTVITFAAIILGIAGGFKLMGTAMLMLDDNFDINKSVLPYIAFGVVFIIIVLLVTLLGKFIRSSIDDTFLGRIDHAVGGFVGILKTAFMASVALWIISSLASGYTESWEEDAVLYPIVVDFAPVTISWMGEWIPAFKDIF